MVESNMKRYLMLSKMALRCWMSGLGLGNRDRAVWSNTFEERLLETGEEREMERGW